VPGCGTGGDNLNKIHGSWESAIGAEQYRQLLAVEHDHRWSFAMYLPPECARQCDAYFGPEAVEKVVEDGTLHLLCYQSRKTERVTGAASAEGAVVVGHTTLAWAKRNARASGRDERLLREVTERMAETLKLDGSISRTMLGSKVITWKQCHVTKPVPKNDATGPCMLLSAEPPLLLAGDYFTASNFGGCATSAFAAAEVVAKALKRELPASMLVEADGGDAGDKGKGKKRKGDHGKGGDRSKGGGYQQDWGDNGWWASDGWSTGGWKGSSSKGKGKGKAGGGYRGW